MAQVRAKHPDLDRVHRLDELLKRRTHLSGKQLAVVNEAVQSFPLLAEKFKHVNSQMLRRVIELVEIRHLHNGEIIFKGGTTADTAYLVLFGAVYLSKGPIAPTV